MKRFQLSYLHYLVVTEVDESILPTGYKIMGDGIVYDEVWDETAEVLTSGDDSDIFEDCE